MSIRDAYKRLDKQISSRRIPPRSSKPTKIEEVRNVFRAETNKKAQRKVQ